MSFSKDFLWGAASAAFQVEGAYNEDGKGLGIWDVMVDNFQIKHGENGNVATDHYHRYKEDVALMKKIGLKAYRFSVSWPRVMPQRGVINEKGLEFYSNLVDELLGAGITPMVTLYHWNLPMWAHEYGGWESEEIIEDFAAYTKAVVQKLSNRVEYWMTINEPQCMVTFGYKWGMAAPYLKKPEKVEEITRIIMLTHGKAVQTIREYAILPSKVGYAPTGGGFTPWDDSKAAIEEAREKTYSLDAHTMANTWWSDPIVLGVAPEPLKNVLSEEDLKSICQPLDFFAYNVYNSSNYGEEEGKVNSRVYPGLARTAFDWPITPEVLYWTAKFHYERYHLPILVSENGMANRDFVMLDGKVHDPQRTDFICRYVKELKQAAEEGVPVLGYLYWSILDNLEWNSGYDMRFGLIYVDYRTLERTLKDSAYSYSEIIRTNGENL